MIGFLKTSPKKFNAILIILIGVIVILSFRGQIRDLVVTAIFGPRSTNNNSSTKQGVTLKNVEESKNSVKESQVKVENPITIIAENLTVPWDLVFMSDNEILLTQRPGKLTKLRIDGKRVFETDIEGVAHIGEGGLLGLTLDPDFKTNSNIYIYLTTRNAAGYENEVRRYTLKNDQLLDEEIILSGIIGNVNHDGGKIAFGPDGYLYVTTGDAQNPRLAQDKNSLNGKILRIGKNGEIPESNPFGNAVYSYGHRNPQGLTWNDRGELWATEHGPSGAQSGYDELNKIELGGNYGWPDFKGEEGKVDEEDDLDPMNIIDDPKNNINQVIIPKSHSGADDTWAPGGALAKGNSVFFVGLRGAALYQAKIESDKVYMLLAHFKNEFGRLRAITQGPDGYIYITTSNKDGRGIPKGGDDKIIRIDPKIFEL